MTLVPPESGRYAARALFVGGLWAPPSTWRAFASFLAHRGWEGHLLDVHGLGGGLAARAAAVAEYASRQPAPPVLIGHDAGGLVAFAAAHQARLAGVVALAPLPSGAAVRATLLGWRALAALLLGRSIPPPKPADRYLADLPAPSRAATAAGLRSETREALLDVLRDRVRPRPLPGVPALVLAGDRDPLLAGDAAERFGASAGAEVTVLPGAGHWPHVEPVWRQGAGQVHRWLVQRLGEPLLDLYAEAMAERDADEDEPSG